MLPSDDDIRRILRETRTIALVGWSPKADRPSHRVANYLVQHGYRVIPVNPGQSGALAPWGEPVSGALSDIYSPVDMIDIFRNSDAVPLVVDEALRHFPGLKTIWMQLGVVHQGAADKARAAGVTVVMNRCPAIEIPRLLG